MDDFNEDENNKLLSAETLQENSLLKTNTYDDDYLLERPKTGSISDYLEYSYSISSSYSEGEKDKSNYIIIHNSKDFLIMFSLLFCS